MKKDICVKVFVKMNKIIEKIKKPSIRQRFFYRVSLLPDSASPENAKKLASVSVTKEVELWKLVLPLVLLLAALKKMLFR